MKYAYGEKKIKSNDKPPVNTFMSMWPGMSFKNYTTGLPAGNDKM